MRLKNILRNTTFNMIFQIVYIFFGFFSQRALNLYIGAELVGMNSVISNVIAMLSVTELGVSTAIVYHLYKSIAEDNKEEIAVLMNLYRKAYHLFALTVTVLGLIILPFIHLFMTNNSYSVGYIRILYLMWLLRTVLSYLLTYRTSLLIASQRGYIDTCVSILGNILNYSAIILFATYTGKYLPALGISIAVDFILGICRNRYVDKKYPFLVKYRKKNPSRQMVSSIINDLKDIFVSRISLRILTSTDSLIISGFINVTTVGLYSNYSLITNTISILSSSLSSAIQPTIGDIFTDGDVKKEYAVVRQMCFLFFMLTTVFGVGLGTLINPFVQDIWLGKDYLMEQSVVLTAVAACMLRCIDLPLSAAMEVSGMFRKERNLSVITASVNLVVSLALVKPLGVTGVLLGTCLSYLIQLIYRIHVFFKTRIGYRQKRYVLDMTEYLMIFLGELLLMNKLIPFVYGGTFFSFLFCMILCVIIVTGINILIYCRSWRLRSILGLLRGIRTS